MLTKILFKYFFSTLIEIFQNLARTNLLKTCFTFQLNDKKIMLNIIIEMMSVCKLFLSNFLSLK